MKLEYIENSFPIISIMVMMLAEMEETNENLLSVRK